MWVESGAAVGGARSKVRGVNVRQRGSPISADINRNSGSSYFQSQSPSVSTMFNRQPPVNHGWFTSMMTTADFFSPQRYPSDSPVPPVHHNSTCGQHSSCTICSLNL